MRTLALSGRLVQNRSRVDAAQACAAYHAGALPAARRLSALIVGRPLDLLTSTLSASENCLGEKPMTMHEALAFISELHRFLHQDAKPDVWCWPTREQCALNLRANREAFPRDKNPRWAFNRQLGIGFGRHYVVIEPCGPECHTKHVRLTAVGEEALKLMNEQGCSPTCMRNPHELKLHLERSAA